MAPSPHSLPSTRGEKRPRAVARALIHRYHTLVAGNFRLEVVHRQLDGPVDAAMDLEPPGDQIHARGELERRGSALKKASLGVMARSKYFIGVSS